MISVTIDKLKDIAVDTDTMNDDTVELMIPSRSEGSFVVTLTGNIDKELTLNATAENDCHVIILIINHMQGKLTLNESYHIGRDNDLTIAHCQLNEASSELNCNYYLEGEGSELKVNTVSLSSTVKLFNQDVYHQKGHTTATVTNYGVVKAHGRTEIVVRNTIQQGSHISKSHQTSRLLTFDKSAIGKILPVLYIYDNDVEASHAATMGQPDEAQIFYLQTRGLSQKEALDLIMAGYLLPITTLTDNERINEMLKKEIEDRL